jgi:hypothetical protein
VRRDLDIRRLDVFFLLFQKIIFNFAVGANFGPYVHSGEVIP